MDIELRKMRIEEKKDKCLRRNRIDFLERRKKGWMRLNEKLERRKRNKWDKWWRMNKNRVKRSYDKEGGRMDGK